MGKSLVPKLPELRPTSREPIVSELTEDSHNPPRRAIIKGDYKLITFGAGCEVPALQPQEDPGEQTDLSKTEPEKLEEMKALSKAFYEKVPTVEPHGGTKLKEGGTARGPREPPKAAETKDGG